MVSNKLKRCLSLMIALALCFSLIPTGVQASETGTEVQPTETETATAETAGEVQNRMQAILTQYSVTSDMSDDEIVDSIIAEDGNTLEATIQEIEEIDSILTGFDEGDVSLFDMELLDTYDRFCLNLQLLMTPALLAAVDTTILDGQIRVTATLNTDAQAQGTCTVLGNVVTIKSRGDKGANDGRQEQLVTLYNNTDNKATLSFDYAISGSYDYIKINDVSITSGGNFSGQLDPGGSVTIKTKGKMGSWFSSEPTALTLTLSGFSLKPVAETSDVKVEFDSSLGSVTVDGTTVSSGYEETGIEEGKSIVLAATANSGTTFHGWIDTSNGRILSTDASHTLTPTADMTVKAVFTGTSSSYFAIGSTTSATWQNHIFGAKSNTYYTITAAYIYEGLNAAAEAAAGSATNKVVFPLSNATLTSGTYTIPSGVTLLIPFECSENKYTMYTTVPQEGDGELNYVKPTAYRTLTMENGANLVIEGNMSISGRINYASNKANEASPIGPVGFVNMESGSTITVGKADGTAAANLYAWGYITGSGTVTVHKNASVYECFQFCGYRGGTVSTSMADGVFPLSQYYVQNVEVPLTLKYGAKEYTYTVIFVSDVVIGSTVNFVGTSGCMFNLTNSTTSSITKRYDGSTDRLIIDVEGDWSLSSVELTLSATESINSADYVMPINNNITININSGTAMIEQDLALLPGVQVNIDSYAKLQLGSGKSVYVYDASEWGNFVYIECYPDNATQVLTDYVNIKKGGKNVPIQALSYAPGKADGVDRENQTLSDASICVNGTIDASAGYLYTTESGANIYSTNAGIVKIDPDIDITGSETKPQTATHQLVQNTGNTEIPITSAKLKNVDGSFTLTENYATTNTYTYVDGFWRCGTHSWDWAQGVCTVCGEKAIRYDAVNLSVEGEILLNLKFYIHEDAITNGLSVTVTEEANAVVPAGNTWTATVVSNPENIEGLRKDNDDERYVIYQGIAAGEMTGDVTVQFMTGTTPVPIYDDSTKLGTELTKTVLDYVNLVLAAEDGSRDYLAELKAMCQKAVTFGGYAQLFYGTDTTNPAYKILGTTAPSLDGADAALAEVAATTRSGSNGVTATTQKLNLDSKIYIRTYFTLPNGKTGDNYSITVKGPTNYGKGTFTDTTVKLQYEDASGRWYVDILNVPPMYWDDIYTIEITDSTGTYTVTTSVLAWCARCVSAQNASAEQKNMARAMYFYNAAANAYFTAKYGT